MKPQLDSMKTFSLLFMTLFIMTACLTLHLTSTVDLVGPLFTFSITNLTSNETVEEEDSVLDVQVGDKIDIRVNAINYNEKADNNITVSLFDIEKSFNNQEGATLTVEIPSIDPGKYPVTTVFDSRVASTATDMWTGIPTNEKTIYLFVK